MAWLGPAGRLVIHENRNHGRQKQPVSSMPEADRMDGQIRLVEHELAPLQGHGLGAGACFS